LSALDDFGLASTLPAADAALGPVCRLFTAIGDHLRPVLASADRTRHTAGSNTVQVSPVELP
jgi:hypothetical protein